MNVRLSFLLLLLVAGCGRPRQREVEFIRYDLMHTRGGDLRLELGNVVIQCRSPDPQLHVAQSGVFVISDPVWSEGHSRFFDYCQTASVIEFSLNKSRFKIAAAGTKLMHGERVIGLKDGQRKLVTIAPNGDVDVELLAIVST